jgi:hypothetical protein
MGLRLAFAVAAHVQPPIIAVDEVLAVGDAEFREKCLGTMSDLGEQGRTVVFVSHDLGAIAQLCSRTIWLEGGLVARDGPTPEVLPAYLHARLAQTPRIQVEPDGRGPVELLGAEVTHDQDAGVDMVQRDRPITIRVRFEVRERLPLLDMAISLVNGRGVTVIDESFADTGSPNLAGEVGQYEASMTLPPVLASDDYMLGLWMGAGNDTYVHRDLFTFHLWPGPDDPRHWPEKLRVAQPDVQWHVVREHPAQAPATP